MHPASSLILFTTLSGLGFGLMAWLGVDMTPPSGWVAAVFYAIAFALAGAGLLASTRHLGRPERALKAFTQWRSSWLSREAWLAVAALGVNGLAALLRIFGHPAPVLGVLGAVLALATVGCTAMIYAQLRTVPRWYSPLTPALFLALAVAGGALLAGRVTLTLWLLPLAGVVQLVAWRMGDGAFARSGSTLNSATGLRGGLRSFAPPHEGPNYLTREMMHVVGRKHATKLRVIGWALAFAVPVALLLLPFGHWLGLLAVLSNLGGVLVLRWLFFAQAEHVVGLYYGAR